MRLQRSKGRFSPTSYSFTVHDRTLKATREGVFFIILVFGIGFGAINTGINLLYLILAMCLSFIIVSGILSEISLRKIIVTRSIPNEIFAAQPFPVQLIIENQKKWFPTYSIWLEEDIPLLKNVNSVNIPKTYIYNIKAGGLVKKTSSWMIPERGLFETDGFKISTGYPFGFFIKTAIVRGPKERVIYPEIKEIEDTSEHFANIGEFSSPIKGEGNDILGFREFEYGDSSKMIHWKTTAKVNDLMIKEHLKEESQKIAILFDNQIDAPDSVSRYNFSKQFNNGVSQAASIANHYIQNGYEVKLMTHDHDIPFGSGYGHLSTILYHLALLKLADKESDSQFPVHETTDGIIRLSYEGKYL